MIDSPDPIPFTQLYADEVLQRSKAKELRLQSSTLRAEAKSLPTDKAKELRQQAKTLGDQAAALRASAKILRQGAIQGLETAAHDMTRRMPPEFSIWGAMKTRGYAKLLSILSSQATRIHPNLQLASRAFDLLRRHSDWSDDEATRLGSLPKSPKTLP